MSEYGPWTLIGPHAGVGLGQMVEAGHRVLPASSGEELELPLGENHEAVSASNNTSLVTNGYDCFPSLSTHSRGYFQTNPNIYIFSKK